MLTKGKGPIGQLGLPLGLPLNPELAGFGLAVWVGFFLVAGLPQAHVPDPLVCLWLRHYCVVITALMQGWC